MNVIKEINRINEVDLANGIYGGKEGSWHHQYKDSAWYLLIIIIIIIIIINY